MHMIDSIRKPVQTITEVQPFPIANCYPAKNIIRLKDYYYTRPVLISDVICESSALEEIKGAVMDEMHNNQLNGNVSDVSFYLKKFEGGDWTSVNTEELYEPGSLMKIPILITVLKQAETDPSFLSKQLLFTGTAKADRQQHFNGGTMETGKKYTISELLNRMITDSDNDATILLQNNMDFSIMQKLFTDLNLPQPNVNQKKYLITVRDCVKFLRILFNSSYLNHDMSEYALDLLTHSKFDKALVHQLPTDVKVAHKFGDSGLTGGEVQLHEEGIIYLNNNPYLLAIMTKGKDFDKMANCISSISAIVYNKMAAKP